VVEGETHAHAPSKPDTPDRQNPHPFNAPRSAGVAANHMEDVEPICTVPGSVCLSVCAVSGKRGCLCSRVCIHELQSVRPACAVTSQSDNAQHWRVVSQRAQASQLEASWIGWCAGLSVSEASQLVGAPVCLSVSPHRPDTVSP
jgi:hypothetical protein